MGEGEPEKIRLGISACLLGAPVRYDGGHKRDAFLTETLGPFVEWVPVCPEVDIGLGVPRDTLRLLAVNIGPLPLPPRGRYEWRCHINDETREDWRLAFSVRGAAIKG